MHFSSLIPFKSHLEELGVFSYTHTHRFDLDTYTTLECNLGLMRATGYVDEYFQHLYYHSLVGVTIMKDIATDVLCGCDNEIFVCVQPDIKREKMDDVMIYGIRGLCYINNMRLRTSKVSLSEMFCQVVTRDISFDANHWKNRENFWHATAMAYEFAKQQPQNFMKFRDFMTNFDTISGIPYNVPHWKDIFLVDGEFTMRTPYYEYPPPAYFRAYEKEDIEDLDTINLIAREFKTYIRSHKDYNRKYVNLNTLHREQSGFTEFFSDLENRVRQLAADRNCLPERRTSYLRENPSALFGR